MNDGILDPQLVLFSDEITKFLEAELQRVNQNVFSHYNTCSLANGGHFQYLLWNGKFLSDIFAFKSVIMLLLPLIQRVRSLQARLASLAVRSEKDHVQTKC